MKVELLNKEYLKENFLKDWGVFSAICYDTDVKYAEKIGKHCLKAQHFSGGRHIPFIFSIEDISRACANQLVRHNVGVTVNQRSQRYVDEDDFCFVIPHIIEEDDNLVHDYLSCMEKIQMYYIHMQDKLLKKGYSKEEANQDARYVLPNACYTKMNVSFTLEALINLAHKRLCTRAQWEIRELVRLMCKQAINVIPELNDLLTAPCANCKEIKSCKGVE